MSCCSLILHFWQVKSKLLIPRLSNFPWVILPSFPPCLTDSVVSIIQQFWNEYHYLISFGNCSVAPVGYAYRWFDLRYVIRKLRKYICSIDFLQSSQRREPTLLSSLIPYQNRFRWPPVETHFSFICCSYDSGKCFICF